MVIALDLRFLHMVAHCRSKTFHRAHVYPGRMHWGSLYKQHRSCSDNFRSRTWRYCQGLMMLF